MGIWITQEAVPFVRVHVARLGSTKAVPNATDNEESHKYL